METNTFSPKKLVFNTEQELNAFYVFCDIVLKAHGMSAKNNVDYFLDKLENAVDEFYEPVTDVDTDTDASES